MKCSAAGDRSSDDVLKRRGGRQGRQTGCAVRLDLMVCWVGLDVDLVDVALHTVYPVGSTLRG